ncbi:MAG: HIRAN domain-containing protein [Acidobacteria bacterium]|nr:HIRAN domain-containing protein [Acidobacteriota bacterium]
MRVFFVAWQDPERRKWYPVARLEFCPGHYEFVYTKGAEQAQREAGFEPLASFPDLRKMYVSQKLFPLISNRLLTENRPEYQDYLEWLSLPANERDPAVILARNGGRRVTDTLEVFPRPEQTEQGYQVHFLLHGLRHMPEAAVERTLKLQPDERLLPMIDLQNPRDPEAIALCTAETSQKDVHVIGYCPRYLRRDFRKLLKTEEQSFKVTVVRVNPPPAPLQFRVLCRASTKWPADFEPFSDIEYEPRETEDVEAVSAPSR